MMVEKMESGTVEQREELMVSPIGSLPTFRTAYFLRPRVTSIDGPPLRLPFLAPKSRWPLEVTFSGWTDPFVGWKSWVQDMSSKYKSVWVQAGIHEAVMCTICKIQRDTEFLYGVGERWCTETNTFIFPWGEATVTLEDVMILGGFSVMGENISLHVEKEEMLRWDAIRKKVSQLHVGRETEGFSGRWTKFFRGMGGALEHEGFLVLWLWGYVFPGIHLDTNCMPILSMAIHLAKGTRLALAPAVLASIYRDLGLLREAMVQSTKLLLEEGESFLLSLTLWAPLHLVQVWVWERFPSLRPMQNIISSLDVRLALWAGPKQSDIGNMRPAIESAGDEFQWRPYTKAVSNWRFPSYFVDEHEVVMKCEGLSLELESFARCLRVCQLLGTDCQEPYNPHRVAMQFGYDQDLPGWTGRDNTGPELAWFYYCKAFDKDEILYLPHRAFESDVTVGYLDWWRKTVLCPLDPYEGGRGPRTIRKALKDPQDMKRRVPGYDPLAPPGFGPKKLGEQNKTLYCLSQFSTSCEVHGDGILCSNFMPKFDPSCRSYAGSVLLETKKPCSNGVSSTVGMEVEMKPEVSILHEQQRLDSIPAKGSKCVELRNTKQEEEIHPDVQVPCSIPGNETNSKRLVNYSYLSHRARMIARLHRELAEIRNRLSPSSDSQMG